MQLATHVGRTARRLALPGALLLVGTTGTAAAHGGGSYGGGMMGGAAMGTGWGLFGGVMGLWGLLWTALLLGVPLYLIYALGTRRDDGAGDRSLEVLRERYARGDISEEEFGRRRERLDRTR